jgi:hypothetical protein
VKLAAPTPVCGRKTEGDHLHTGDRLLSDAYEIGVKKPEKTLKMPWGSVYEQVTSGPG